MWLEEVDYFTLVLRYPLLNDFEVVVAFLRCVSLC